MERTTFGVAGAVLFAGTCLLGCAEDLSGFDGPPDDPVERVYCERVSTNSTEAHAAPPGDLEAAPTLVTWETTLLHLPEGGVGWARLDLTGVGEQPTILIDPPVPVELRLERPDGPVVFPRSVGLPCRASALVLGAPPHAYLWIRLGPAEEVEPTVATYYPSMSACE